MTIMSSSKKMTIQRIQSIENILIFSRLFGDDHVETICLEEMEKLIKLNNLISLVEVFKFGNGGL